MSILLDIYSKNEILKLSNHIVDAYTKQELKTLSLMHSKKLNAPLSSSVGRLFDVVYAFMGIPIELSYEGESGLIIESYYDTDITDIYDYEIVNGVVDYTKMIIQMLKENDKNAIASKFINTLAHIILNISKRYNYLEVILCGGVFQNTTLLKIVMDAMDKEGIIYHIQSKTTLNDGSISLGQVYYAKCLVKEKLS